MDSKRFLSGRLSQRINARATSRSARFTSPKRPPYSPVNSSAAGRCLAPRLTWTTRTTLAL